MPYQKGHPYHAPKVSLPGVGKVRSKHQRVLALAVQERIPAGIFVEYHLAIAMGKPGVVLDEDEDGEIIVAWDDSGGEPTQAERTSSVNWLSDRGHGLPAQSIQLEANIRQHTTQIAANVNVGALTAGQMAMIRAALRAPAGLPERVPIPASVTDGAIDVVSEERAESNEVEATDTADE